MFYKKRNNFTKKNLLFIFRILITNAIHCSVILYLYFSSSSYFLNLSFSFCKIFFLHFLQFQFMDFWQNIFLDSTFSFAVIFTNDDDADGICIERSISNIRNQGGFISFSSAICSNSLTKFVWWWRWWWQTNGNIYLGIFITIMFCMYTLYLHLHFVYKYYTWFVEKNTKCFSYCWKKKIINICILVVYIFINEKIEKKNLSFFHFFSHLYILFAFFFSYHMIVIS